MIEEIKRKSKLASVAATALFMTACASTGGNEQPKDSNGYRFCPNAETVEAIKQCRLEHERQVESELKAHANNAAVMANIQIEQQQALTNEFAFTKVIETHAYKLKKALENDAISTYEDYNSSVRPLILYASRGEANKKNLKDMGIDVDEVWHRFRHFSNLEEARASDKNLDLALDTAVRKTLEHKCEDGKGRVDLYKWQVDNGASKQDTYRLVSVTVDGVERSDFTGIFQCGAQGNSECAIDQLPGAKDVTTSMSEKGQRHIKIHRDDTSVGDPAYCPG